MSSPKLPRRADVVVVGAGHNGLVAAVLLARAGLSVVVLEAAPVVGGACRTERPFDRAPELPASTGAYLLGLMPPELLALLDLDLPLVRRDPHYFLPLPDGRHLLLGSTPSDTLRTARDRAATAALDAELSALREDLAPSWLAPPLPLAETAERFVRPALRSVYRDLVGGSAMSYLDRFGFETEELVAMYAVTDGMPGLAGSPWTPGSGHNLLVHNMCRLPGADGTWMTVAGGMGTVTDRLAAAARRAGAVIIPGCPVAAIAPGLVRHDRGEIATTAVVAACDPHRLAALLDLVPPALAARLQEWRARPGMTLKVNLALSGSPRFAALPEERGQSGTTTHLLPPPAADGSVLTALRTAYDDALAGRLPETPPLEWYVSGLSDGAGRSSSALFVQGVPNAVAGSSWPSELPSYVDHLLDLVAAAAPGLRDLVVDVQALAPSDLEAHFGLTDGHIFHVDNAFALEERMPCVVPELPGIYAGGAGCHPAGSVIGCAGHNAAERVLADLGLPAAARPR